MNLPDAYVWWAIAGLVAVVFATRNAFAVLPQRWQPRGALERALRFAPSAALVALIVPAACAAWLGPGVEFASALRDPRLPAVIVTVAVSRLARSPLPGLLAGAAVLLAIEALA
jgi:branched-subunit amino acid transport protein